MEPRSARAEPGARLRSAFAALPRGRPLPLDVWRRRHHAVQLLLYAHSVVIFLFAYAKGFGLAHSFFEAVAPAGFALVATAGGERRTLRSTIASAGLISSSAIITHLSGGYIEAHFHFFIMLAVIALYQEWVPFLLSIAYVVLHHGVVGVLDPSSVYNHPAAIESPWVWAGIHATAIAGASAVYVVAWRFHEDHREHTEMLLRSAGDGVYGLDLEGRTTFVNDAAARMLGRSVEELLGTNMHQMLHHSRADRTPYPAEACPIHQTLRDAAERRSEDEVFWRKDGGSFPVEYTTTPIIQRGQLRGAVVTFRDVTERRRVEGELRSLTQALDQRVVERTRELARLNEQLDAFNGMVAHDLRAPLRAVDHLVTVLDEEHARELSPEARELLSIVSRSNRQMRALVDDLLAFARADKARMAVEEVDVGAVARESFAQFAKQDEGRKVELELEGPAPMRARADPGLLRVVLDNLMSNAWKFTRAKSDARIAVGSARTPAGERAFYVRDNGAGFDEARAARLFTPFERLHSVTEFEGTGLGLATVRRIAERHGGRAWAEGASGKGATFWFTLGTPER